MSANTWGGSWGASWGNTWGPIDSAAVVVRRRRGDANLERLLREDEELIALIAGMIAAGSLP